jgi:hypothetical protein
LRTRGPPERDALAFPAAQVARFPIEEMLEPEHRGDRLAPPVNLRIAEAAYEQIQLHIGRSLGACPILGPALVSA